MHMTVVHVEHQQSAGPKQTTKNIICKDTDLSRFLRQTTDEGMAVSPRTGSFVVALDDDSLLAGMASLKDDHDLARLHMDTYYASCIYEISSARLHLRK